MATASATMTSKGQVTMPKKVRDRLNLKTGDIVDFVEEDGRVFLRPRTLRVADLAGMLGNPLGRPTTLKEMDKAVGKYLAEDDARITREWHQGRGGS